MSDVITLNGCDYRVTTEPDCDLGAPWEEHDGHGVVSDWTRRDKKPGEVVIASDRGSHRFYDVAETMRLAKRDGWGLGAGDLAAFEARIGRKATRKMIVAEAVRRDCERMRQWCNDIWHWCGVIVSQLGEDGGETGEHRSLWGIESDDYAYHDEVAHELAEEMESERASAMAADIEASRPDMHA